MNGCSGTGVAVTGRGLAGVPTKAGGSFASGPSGIGVAGTVRPEAAGAQTRATAAQSAASVVTRRSRSDSRLADGEVNRLSPGLVGTACLPAEGGFSNGGAGVAMVARVQG